MYEDEEYRFCPECGSLMKDGVCMNCGCSEAGAEGIEEMPENAPFVQEPQTAQAGRHEEAKEEIKEERQMGESPVQGTGAERPPYGSGNGPFCKEQSVCGQEAAPSYDHPGQGSGQPPYGHSGQGSGQSAYGYAGQGGGQPPYGYAGQGVGQPPYGYAGQGGSQPPYGYAGQGGGQPPYGYAGQGGGQPPYGYPGYPYGSKEPLRGDGGKVLAAVVIAVAAVVVCALLFLTFFLVKWSVGAAVRQNGYYGQSQEPGGGAYGQMDPPYGEATPPYGEAVPSPEQEERDPYAWNAEPEGGYVPSAEDDYYVTLADALRDDLSYSVEWKEYSYEDEETGATAAGRYPQLVGEHIPNLDELNASIEEEATYYSNLYGYIREWQSEDLTFEAVSIGYVTYMDEEKLSVVLEEEFRMDGEISISLYSINIDLVSGQLMDNGAVIEYSLQLAEEFRSQNDYQNGYVEVVNSLSDEELLDFLSDENTNIVFYTPVGLEIGFNYTTADSTGWVTATIKDYERYVKKF